ncbi:MAG: sodium/glutamate symporter [Synoicihabitans sp.]
MEKFAAEHFFGSLLLLGLFLFLGHVIKALFFRNLIVPPSLIGGTLAFLLGPELLGGLLVKSTPDGWGWNQSEVPAAVADIWRQMPGYWITVVFAGLFLGTKIPSPRQILDESLPNLAFGYSLAFGQYLVGVFVAVAVLQPLLDTNVLAGALIAIGFQGGHGTVAGLSETFSELGFEDGTDLGLGVATLGLISAIAFGTLMSNLGRNKNGNQPDETNPDQSETTPDNQAEEPSFGLQFGILAFTITVAWIGLKGLVAVESLLLPEDGFRIFKYVPLFPVAMMVGLVVQLVAERGKFAHHISQKHMAAISGLALDLLIVAALGSLSLQTLGANIGTVLILASVGVAYNVIIYFTVARKLFGKSWRIRGLGELGQSMGTTAIGLILIKRGGSNSADYEKPFSYKQPFYEPIVGGGLVTALALPLLSNWGPWIFMGVVSVVMVGLGITYRSLKP